MPSNLPIVTEHLLNATYVLASAGTGRFKAESSSRLPVFLRKHGNKYPRSLMISTNTSWLTISK